MTHKTRRYKRKKRHNKRKGESKKHNNTKKKFKLLKCSPKNKDKVLDFTCYTSESLHKLKKIWNARHPDVLIQSNTMYGVKTMVLAGGCNVAGFITSTKETLMPSIKDIEAAIKSLSHGTNDRKSIISIFIPSLL